MVVMRKDARPVPGVEELLRVDLGDARELESLRFNLELLKERVAEFWSSDAVLRSENEHLRGELATVTGSKSWKLTEPLRRLRGLASRR
jgi:hypothetical protein